MFFSRFIATLGYVGYLPKAPGTWGTLVALPLVFFPSYIVFSVSVVSFFVGWWATYVLLSHQNNNDKDPSYIVIDEFAAMALFLSGAGVCGGVDPLYWGQQVLMIACAFAFFRFFDIIKPWPIGVIDAYFKNQSNVWAAFGVMIDDILAVIFALPLYYAFSFGIALYVAHFKESLLP